MFLTILSEVPSHTHCSYISIPSEMEPSAQALGRDESARLYTAQSRIQENKMSYLIMMAVIIMMIYDGHDNAED